MKTNVKEKTLSLLLCLVILLSLVPMTSLTAFAGVAPPYADLKNTTTAITFDNKQWYLIDYDSTTVALLSKECVAASKFGSKNTYSGSTVETAVNNYYTNNISADAKAAVNGNGMFLLTTAQANAMTTDQRKCAQASGASANIWWLCSAGKMADRAACVAGGSGYIDASFSYVHHVYGVRPALKLDLSKAWFDKATNTFTLSAPHEHDFTYSANGATITATCSAEGCTLTDGKVTLTIVKPTLTTYGGAGKATATLTGLDVFNTATGLNIAVTDIKYYIAEELIPGYKKLADELDKAPTDVGDYFAGLTLSDVKNGENKTGDIRVTVFYTIDKAPGEEATLNDDYLYCDPNAVTIEGVKGQEYIIVPKGKKITEKDWENSVKPDPERDDCVFFGDLKAATEYEIYARVAENKTNYAGIPKKIDFCTSLESVGAYYDSTLVGVTVEIEPDPEVSGLIYKWYQNDITVDEEEYQHDNLTEISGVTGKTYTFREEDVDKYIAVKIFLGDNEVGEFTTMDPVSSKAIVIFDSMGGSDVDVINGVKYNSKITKPEDPTKEGYVFEGWYWEEEFYTKFDFDKDTITWNETTLYAKWEPIAYNIVSVDGLSGKGKDQWTKGGKAGVVITVKNNGNEDSFDHFTGVKLDGKELVKDKDYTVKKGSTIVTLAPKTLEKLSVGEHTVTVLFDNGEVNTALTILEPGKESTPSGTSPKTEDNSNLVWWFGLMALSLLGITAMFFYGRKKRTFYR